MMFSAFRLITFWQMGEWDHLGRKVLKGVLHALEVLLAATAAGFVRVELADKLLVLHLCIGERAVLAEPKHHEALRPRPLPIHSW